MVRVGAATGGSTMLAAASSRPASGSGCSGPAGMGRSTAGAMIPADEVVITASSLMDVRLPAGGMDCPAERSVARPAVAVMARARRDRAERRHAADRAVEIVGLRPVEDHAGQLGPDVHQMADRL